MSCFFFKQKTSYELRISDWSSDVCSSDLKAGSFDGSNPVDLTFDPETVVGYEIGMKRASYDNRFLLNVAAFRSEYQDLQVSIFNPETTRNTVQNVGSSISHGIEEIGRATWRERVCKYV